VLQAGVQEGREGKKEVTGKIFTYPSKFTFSTKICFEGERGRGGESK
jgi:hypothetical protein